MARIKPQFTLSSYGIYSSWDEKDKKLPKLKHITTEVSAELDIEFGVTINVKKAKGIKLNFCIYHPNILDEKGSIMPPFSGEVYVKNNNWDFYLGDTIWSPLGDKLGYWRMEIKYQDTIIVDKTFHILNEQDYYVDDYAQFTKSARKGTLKKYY